MPLFDFKCPKCEYIEENVIIMLNNQNEKIECPKCKTKMEKMLINTFYFRLLGDGWTPKFGK